MFIQIVIITFILLELSNVLALYFAPGSKVANAVGVFTAWEQSKQYPVIHEFVKSTWVLGVGLLGRIKSCLSLAEVGWYNQWCGGSKTMNENMGMTLQDIIEDIHALTEDIEVHERKYGVLSETFYESYINGEEPEDDAWVLDWGDWAGAYKILLRRQEQYRRTMQVLREQAASIVDVIERTTQRERIPVAS
jgi:hypothetical protein